MDNVWKQWEGQVVNGELPLRRYLGGSEHSSVFLTERRDADLQRTAIKLIPAGFQGSEKQLSRLRAAAKLSHPNLIRLFTTGNCQLGEAKLLYAVMEFADEDLSQVLPDRTLTPSEALDMLRPVLGVLTFLHGQGLVHTRLKPRNVMAIDDQVKLSSDGICEQGQSDGVVAKRNIYDAPEMASGRISSAADIWSLGVMLVESLTQHLPKWDETGRGEPSVPETLQQPFRDVALRCLRRDPQERWGVADIALRLNLDPSRSSKRATALPHITQGASARPRFAGQLVAAGLALVIVLAGWGLFSHRKQSRRNTSIMPERATAAAQPKPAPGMPAQTGPSKREEGSTETSSADSPATAPKPAAAPTVAGGVSARPEILQQALPDVSKSARDTITGTLKVTVRVTVDSSGKVANATFDSPGPSKYFAHKAMEAAQRWKFSPARQTDSNQWILRFQFRKSGTNVVPAPATP